MKWPLVQVGEIASQHRGVSYSKEESRDQPANGFTPIFRANNITDSGLTFTDLVYVPNTRVSEVQRVREGDIVIAASSGSIDVVGKAAQAVRDEEIAFGAFCKLVRPHSRVHPRYLGHYFKTKKYRQTVSSLAAGANINNLRNEHIDNLELALPPLEEQRRITAILDQAEALRAKRRQALIKLDILTQSLFQSLPKTKSHHISLKDLVTFKTGKLDSNAAEADGQYPFFTCAKEDAFINTYAFDQEALLLAGNNAAGEYSVKHYNGKFNAYQRTYVISVDESQCTYEYAKYALQSKLLELKYQSKGTGTKYLTLEILNRLGLAIPSIQDQRAFSQQIAQVKVQETSILKSELQIKQLQTSLQHRAFRGEL